MAITNTASNHSALLKGEQIPFATEKSVLYWVNQQVLKQPDAVALLSEVGDLSYQKLWSLIEQYAAKLTALGVGQSDRVVLVYTPSQAYVAMVLAILYLGAVFVPLDYNYPESRNNYILSKVNPKLVFTNVDQCSISAEIPLYAHFEFEAIVETSIPEPLFDLCANPAYILFTSGSTGNPKGVVVPHLAINNHMKWMVQEFSYTQTDTILFKTPVSFDPSVWEFLAPLYAGAKIAIAPEDAFLNTQTSIAAIKKYSATVVQYIPSMLFKLLQNRDFAACNSLRVIFSGGESLFYDVKQLFFRAFRDESVDLINLYGPTETTIDSTFYRVKKTDSKESDVIGKPIANTSVYVLNQLGALCPDGVLGELYVSGLGLSLGYFGDVEQTKCTFLFNREISASPIYKTGDMAKVVNGEVVYCGRIDQQCKVNGVRVNTNEVKYFISKISNVHSVFVEKMSDEEHNDHLCVYIVPIDVNVAVDIENIKQVISDNFPFYLTPKQYYVVKDYALLPNGKLDKASIIVNENQNTPEHSESLENLDVFVVLQQCWAEVLGVGLEFVLESNFYSLGGNSLRFLQLLSRLEVELNRSIDRHSFMRCNTFYEQYNYLISEESAGASTFIRRIASAEGAPTLVLVHPIGGTVFWFLQLKRYLEGHLNVYVISDPGLLDESNIDRFASISQLAAYYYENLEAIETPVIFGGASFGATVAIEMARYAEKKGVKVDAVFALDGWALYPDNLQNIAFFKKMLITQQERWSGEFVEHNIKLNNDDLFSLQLQRLDLLSKYKQRSLKRPLVLFKSEKISDLFQPIDCWDNYWSSYAAAGLEVALVPGDHETMFYEPNAIKLAEELERLALTVSGVSA